MAPHRAAQMEPGAALLGLATVAVWTLSAFVAALNVYHLPLFGMVALFQVADIWFGAKKARQRDTFDRRRLYDSVGQRLARWRWVLAGMFVDVSFGVMASLTLQLFSELGSGPPPFVGALLIGTQFGFVTACTAAYLGAAETASAIDNARPGEQGFIMPGLRRTPQMLGKVMQPAVTVMGMGDDGETTEVDG